MIIKHSLPIQLLLRDYPFRLLHIDRCENLPLQTHANAVFPRLGRFHPCLNAIPVSHDDSQRCP